MSMMPRDMKAVIYVAHFNHKWHDGSLRNVPYYLERIFWVGLSWKGENGILTYDEKGTLHAWLNHACRMCTVPDNRCNLSYHCFPHNATPAAAATTIITATTYMLSLLANLYVYLPNLLTSHTSVTTNILGFSNLTLNIYRLQLDSCIVRNAHNTVFGSKR